jgi:hypothetical protein
VLRDTRVLYDDDPPQAAGIRAASPGSFTMPREGDTVSRLIQGSYQSPEEWLNVNLHGNHANVQPLIGREVLGELTTARGQQYMRRTPKGHKSRSGPSPYCNQQVRRTDQRHSPGGQFTDIIGNHPDGSRSTILGH